MSQRELAAACGVAPSVIAHAEAGRRGLALAVLARAATVAGFRLALVDASGAEVRPMDDEAVRDMGGRYFPAHLDTRYTEDGWWHGDERYSRPEPWYTFDRLRSQRNSYRRWGGGVPGDHHLPRPGDSPEERRDARRRAARRSADEERARRFAAGELPDPSPWACDCPPGCAELEDWHGPPRHTDDCPCRCDPC